MQGFRQWLIGSSMSWRGLRWGAAVLSLAAHGAAASFSWVMIETKPAQVIEAFTVELVAVDQLHGAIRKKKTVSDSVAADQAKQETKTDLVRAAASSQSAKMSTEVAEPVKKPIEKATPLPRFEIEIARATLVPDPKQVQKIDQKLKQVLPKAVTPKFLFRYHHKSHHTSRADCSRKNRKKRNRLRWCIVHHHLNRYKVGLVQGKRHRRVRPFP